MNLYYGSNTFHMRHISSQNITLEKVMRLEMSSVTLLSLMGALQPVLLILLGLNEIYVWFLFAAKKN